MHPVLDKMRCGRDLEKVKECRATTVSSAATGWLLGHQLSIEKVLLMKEVQMFFVLVNLSKATAIEAYFSTEETTW